MVRGRKIRINNTDNEQHEIESKHLSKHRFYSSYCYVRSPYVAKKPEQRYIMLY